MTPHWATRCGVKIHIVIFISGNGGEWALLPSPAIQATQRRCWWWRVHQCECWQHLWHWNVDYWHFILFYFCLLVRSLCLSLARRHTLPRIKKCSREAANVPENPWGVAHSGNGVQRGQLAWCLYNGVRYPLIWPLGLYNRGWHATHATDTNTIRNDSQVLLGQMASD